MTTFNTNYVTEQFNQLPDWRKVEEIMLLLQKLAVYNDVDASHSFRSMLEELDVFRKACK